MIRLFVLVGMLLGLAGCRPAPAPLACDATRPLWAAYPFPVGVALLPGLLVAGSDYERVAARQFNSVTPGYSFMARYIHPAPGQYEWAETEALAAFCRAHNKRLHGNVLVWHEQLPAWISGFAGSPADWDALLRDHVQTICRHFRGRVTGWDVVNEAFAADGTLRPTVWSEHLGSGYLEKAFRYAHEADPDALLFYNDYDLEDNPVKRQAVLGWLRTMQQRGVPIHGLGLQLHISVRHPENSQLAEGLHEVQQTGLLLHLSEIDMSVNPLAEPQFKLTSELLQRQADKLAFLVHTYRELPPAQQYGITFWGVGDQDTWLRSYYGRLDYPLLFDDNYQPKPAFCALAQP